MQKLILLVTGLMLAGVLNLNAQEIRITPFGVSPYMVSQDTVEQYFDRRFTGTLNVGNETQMYFKGDFVDSSLTNPMWTVIQEPSPGAGVLGTAKVVGDYELMKFTVTEVGTYKLVFSDGTAADTAVINSALYLGFESTPACGVCHSETVDLWEQTGHSDMLVRGLEGTLSSHYGEGCIDCHTVGYDPDASNNGFDDFPFVFPDSLFPGVYQQTVNMYPDAMARANIQCESCHGPGSEHLGTVGDSKMVSDIRTENCAYCHDDGHYHIFPTQWLLSGHGSGETLYGGNRTSCTPCHNGQGFIDMIKGKPQGNYEEIAITCAACHDPHDNTLAHQVRSLSTTLGNGVEITNAGMGGLCYNCHKSRRNAVEYVNNYLGNISSHYGPHHGPQGDLLYGTNVYTWGEPLTSTGHYAATEDKCVSCHMADGEGEIPEAGGHTFRMVYPDDTDNVQACEPCHGNIGDEFADKKFFYNGYADLDNDGVANGLPIEIHGLLDTLAKYLPPYGSTDINDIDSSWTLDEAAAVYNYRYIEEDRSGGIHNPRFAVELLYLSISKVGGPVLEVEGDNNLPETYSLNQNYPNPFNPSTTFEYALPQQSYVSITVYDALGNQIAVLFDGMNEAGVHNINWNASGFASGVYFYRMQANDFVQVKKMLLMK